MQYCLLLTLQSNTNNITMIRTPVMTDKQKRGSLSAKKKPQKALLKNVLAQPFRRYWPQISSEEGTAVITKVAEINQSQTNIWKTSYIKLGLNSTLRALKNCDVNVLLISANIKPKYVVDQVIHLAVAKNPNISILCVPNLNALLADKVKFSKCLCCCFTGIDCNADFTDFFNTVHTMSKRFPKPKSFSSKVPNSMKNVIESAGKSKRDTSAIYVDDLYLPRNSSGRSFIPDGTVMQAKTTDEWSDFISFQPVAKQMNVNKSHQHGVSAFRKKQLEMGLKRNANDDEKPTKTNYITLSVNKVQGNPNKIKRKKQ